MVQYSPVIQEKLDKINELQTQIESMRPIKPEYVAKIFQKYRLDWNYNSNSIEGNSLSYGETVAFIMEGLTAKGKPLKDHLDIKGHNEAINFLLDMQKQGSELMERDIRSLHEMILIEPYQSKAQTADGQETTKTIRLGVYKNSPNHVITKTGETHFYASPEETPALMQELMTWYRENLPVIHPLVLSTLFHHRFINIHPFDDGNGRMSRLLSNLILLQAGLPPVVVRQDGKSEYYGVLSQADAGVTEPLIEYFADLLIHSLDVYLKGARGEDISDPNDLDKELSLFVSSFDDELLSREQLNSKALSSIFEDSLIPLFSRVISYIQKLHPLFHTNYFYFRKEDYGGAGSDYQVLSIDNLGKWLVPNDGVLKEVFLKDFFDTSQDIRRLVFHYVLTGFKANAQAAPCRVNIQITFDNDRYTVVFSDNKIMKYYPRKLSSEESDSIVSTIVRSFMNEVKSRHTTDAQ